MSIANVILFCSSTSPASAPCIHFIRQAKIPVQIVRLDTPELRKKAEQGELLQVRSVPNLVVVYQDGNLQQFVGQQKIMAWFQNMMKNSQSPPPEEASLEPLEESEEEEPVRPRRKKKPKKKKRRKKASPVIEEEEMEIEFFDPQDESPPAPSTQGLLVGPQAASKKAPKMSSIYELSEQMKKQRSQTLGYEEKDLPVSNF